MNVLVKNNGSVMTINDQLGYIINGGNDVPAACFLNSLARGCSAIQIPSSYTNIYTDISRSPYAERLFSEAFNFQQAEKGLLIGHSFHHQKYIKQQE